MSHLHFSGISAPTNFTFELRTENSLRLIWSPSVGIFNDYLLTYHQGPQDHPFDTEYKAKNETSVDVENLLPGYDYRFSIRARKGETSSSEVRLSVTTSKSVKTSKD